MNEARFWKAHEQHFTPPEDDEGVECDECKASGKISQDCEECEASGKVKPIDEHDDGKCLNCAGTGKIEVDCENCEGHGRISTARHRKELREGRADYEYEQRRDKKLMAE